MCSYRKWGTFALDPPPWNSHSRGCLSYPPLPGISVIFHVGWEPPGNDISVNKAVALCCYAKCNCFRGKVRKKFLIDVNTWSN